MPPQSKSPARTPFIGCSPLPFPCPRPTPPPPRCRVPRPHATPRGPAGRGPPPPGTCTTGTHAGHRRAPRPASDAGGTHESTSRAPLPARPGARLRRLGTVMPQELAALEHGPLVDAAVQLQAELGGVLALLLDDPSAVIVPLAGRI